MGHCCMRACDIRAGTVSTSCDPGSSPSSPLTQTTGGDKSSSDWDTCLFSLSILESTQERAGLWRVQRTVLSISELCIPLGKSSKPQSLDSMCALQVLSKIQYKYMRCSLKPHTKCLETIFLALRLPRSIEGRSGRSRNFHKNKEPVDARAGAGPQSSLPLWPKL